MTHAPPADAPLRLPPRIAARLACPRAAHAALERRDGHLRCTRPGCGLVFPIHDGLPVLIDEERSLFRLDDFAVVQRTTLDLRDDAQRHPGFAQRAKARLVGLVPGLSMASSDFDAEAALAAIEAERPGADVLVIGAGDRRYAVAPGTTVVYTDVARGPLIQAIVDAHGMPFADATFDAVLSISVMQYLPDPFQAMREAHRVLRPGGLAYVVAPFMQRNTLGPYDFFLFTHAGLRRVMHEFTELRSGVANGPGMALCWSIESFATSFSERRWLRSLLSNLAHLTVWPLKHFDRWLSRKRGAYDCASAFYFFGRRADVAVPDREISRGYRGMRWAG